MRTATLDARLFKAANAHFHLTALETVSSPGTFSCHVKPRMIPTWSRIKHNPWSLLRCYKIGPFCMASAFGCRKSLSAVLQKLGLFSSGVQLFGVIPKWALVFSPSITCTGSDSSSEVSATAGHQVKQRETATSILYSDLLTLVSKAAKCYKTQGHYIKLVLVLLTTRCFLASLKSITTCQFWISQYNVEQQFVPFSVFLLTTNANHEICASYFNSKVIKKHTRSRYCYDL